ncbi:MAG: DUF2007 domain-containing protein [Dehalococcoidia bacterium]|nr:DUF2007 domain-containing protein [Dehalococcoidia bacterium]
MTSHTQKEEPLVRVATVDSEPMARMLAESLENEGIKCLVKTTAGPGIAGLWAGSVVEHELWVRESQAKEAEDVLEAYWDSEEDQTNQD